MNKHKNKHRKGPSAHITQNKIYTALKDSATHAIFISQALVKYDTSDAA